MQDTPTGDRIHIGFFGRRNSGKSSVVNAVTGQELSVVSDVKGTTTDPVKKSMELLPLGPVLIIDTPGFDDAGSLGELRVEQTRKVLPGTDIAVLVMDSTEGITEADRQLISIFNEKKIPYVSVYNKCDLLAVADMRRLSQEEHAILVSAKDKKNIDQLKEAIALKSDPGAVRPLVSDLVLPGETVLLIVPIDESAPKGRLILPQQQVIRDLLDAEAVSVVCGVDRIADTLGKISTPPRLVITDSQVFDRASAAVPEDIYLTSFSILMARKKGFLAAAVEGVSGLETLSDGAHILIAEGCTHHRQCKDIGTVKLPAMIRKFTGKELRFSFCSGGDFPEDPSVYDLVIHCGGCMIGDREVVSRMQATLAAGVPFTNYGTAIAKMNGILDRSLAIFHGRYA